MQLAAELPECGLALSASKELEPGFRALILLAEGLFRLDVALAGDTIRTTVRNLSAGELHAHGDGGTGGASIAFGEVDSYQPGRADLGFAIGSGADRVGVEVLLGTLRHAKRGTVSVTAQAILRHQPAL